MNNSNRLLYPTHTLIDLQNLDSNIKLLQNLAGKAAMFPAVKANAYGHGAAAIAKKCIDSGYNTLCVAHLPEAIELIQAGLKCRYLIMTPFLPEYAEEIVYYSCIPVVCTREHLHSLSRASQKLGKKVRVHLKVDTGMGRVGIKKEELPHFMEEIAHTPGVDIEGIMSHYARADEEDFEFSEEQKRKFREIQKMTKGYRVRYYHIANSAALIQDSESNFDAVRPGIAMYGLNPFGTRKNSSACRLKPVLSWKTRIVFIKEVPAGAGLSYGHSFITPRQMTIATLPVGYGDGLMRILSNSMDVLINGERCPQVGRICMDQCLVDVSQVKDTVNIGDEVVLIGKQGKQEITAEEIARKAQTINYEVVTSITSRVPRIVTQ